ncbi:MAG: TetR/AcrR family transcriptional regulator [Gordonia sp. (in: high G+C Gram-positive bacteria)]|uniref:TetR/AcrR family transcriptional regulator n=1 Tax=Gordonia sp. (in: high G+C Gram-positive bacteria) TaxID=84139 RepID=UPI0039E3DD93
MSRPSRAEAQAQTRRLLKEVGREMLLRDGYPATSVAALAHTAGFTTGAFYSNFASKAELTLEVLGDLQAEVQAEVSEMVSDPWGPETVDRLEQWSEKILNSGWPRLELEFALAIRDDDGLVVTEGDRNRAAVGGLGAIIADRLPLPGEGPMSADRVAEMIVNLAFGIAVRRVIDPRVTAASVFDVVRLLLPTDDDPDAD